MFQARTQLSNLPEVRRGLENPRHGQKVLPRFRHHARTHNFFLEMLLLLFLFSFAFLLCLNFARLTLGRITRGLQGNDETTSGVRWLRPAFQRKADYNNNEPRLFPDTTFSVNRAVYKWHAASGRGKGDSYGT